VIKRLAVVVLLIGLAACGDSEPAGGPDAGAGDGSTFCENGARIGDTSVLTDVDSSSPEAFEETYDETVATLGELAETAPDEARPAIEAGHEVLVEFRPTLEAAKWDPTELDPEDQSRFINLAQELVDVSPAIREVCV
jgi:hypothetical protein